MKKRVVVTGVGVVSSLGHSTQQTWQAVLKGASGISSHRDDPVLRNPTKSYNLGLVKDFNYSAWKVPHATSRMNAFLSCAVDEALRDSALPVETPQGKLSTGVSIGCMSSNTTRLTEILEEVAANGYDKINRLTMMHILSNIPAATVTVRYGLQGPSSCVSTACATGLSAVVEAYKWIRDGQANAAIAGGVEDVNNATCLHSSIRLQAMSTKQYASPQQSSCPFDEARSGFVLGEGAGVLVLEELESARKRGATVYGEILGYGCTSDGYHLTRPEANGQGVLRSMTKALHQASVDVKNVQHINCHATSTPVGDEAEARAILQLLGGNAGQVSLSAYKSNLGHTFGAAGAIELILALMSMKDGVVPKLLNLERPCLGGLWLPISNIQQNIKCLIKNALGFGGINVSLVMRSLQ